MQKEQILLVGDVHGYFSALLDKIEVRDINNCHLICVGDLGIGFKYGPDGEFAGMLQLNKYFEGRNIKFKSIRGNHDDPSYWTGVDRPNYSNFELLPDYSTLELNGEKWLFVGGGISIDRTIRRPGYTYWKDEVFVLDESKVVECDVLVTHSGPNWIGPFDKEGISGWCKRDETLWDDCLKERSDHNRLYELAKPKKSYLGHFHIYQAIEHGGCHATILDELQIIEHRPYETV